MLERQDDFGRRLLTSEWSGTNFTFSTIVLFQHLNIRIVGQAVFAAGREVCGFPARTVEILFNLWRRHDGSYSSSAETLRKYSVTCEIEAGRSKLYAGAGLTNVLRGRWDV